MTEMTADGFIDQAWRDHYKKISTSDCFARSSTSLDSASSDETEHSLSLEEMAGIFIVHGCLLAVALLWGIRRVPTIEHSD